MALTPLHDRVLDFIRREALAPEGTRVVAALSGGGDSVAMVLLLRELAPHAGFTLAGVAHLDHQLRRAAAEDEALCRELAHQLRLPLRVGRAAVGHRAHRQGISIEEAGHRARYEFFEKIRSTMSADVVATAHTRDDQAETVLMRMLRGAGPAGLAGIHPRAGRVIRPLLDVTRPELRTFLRERGQTHVEDETNQDVTVTRNRVRHELVPLLKARFSPSVVDALARGARIARDDAAWLETAANQRAAQIVSYDEGRARVARRLLAEQPPALARRIVKQAFERVSGTTAGFDEVERLLRLGEDAPEPERVDMRGCAVSGQRERLVISPPRSRGGVAPEPFDYELPVPGEVGVSQAGLLISARKVAGGHGLPDLARGSDTVCLDAHRLEGGLRVRSWRPGDVFRPLGLGGRKKVQDLFVDRKVPRLSRGKVPIVTDKLNGIVWVVGHAVAEDFRVTPDGEGMLILRARSLGGAG